MRCFLTIICLLFITHSCFAVKPADRAAAYRPVVKNKPSLLVTLFNKAAPEGESNISKDYFEHPTFIQQQTAKKNTISSLQLFSVQENKQQLYKVIKVYVANPGFNYNFIYQCLYPKHAFW